MGYVCRAQVILREWYNITHILVQSIFLVFDEVFVEVKKIVDWLAGSFFEREKGGGGKRTLPVKGKTSATTTR